MHHRGWWAEHEYKSNVVGARLVIHPDGGRLGLNLAMPGLLPAPRTPLPFLPTVVV